MSRHQEEMDVGVDDDGEVFVTKNASTLSRQQRQHQQSLPRDRQSGGAENIQPHRPLPTLFNIALERVHGLTLTSNAALTCFAEENLVAYTAGFIIVIYNLRDDKQFFITNVAKKAFTCVAFSNDGRFLATGEAGAAACVRIWSVRDRVQLVELKGGHKQSICCVAFSPRNTKYVVSVGGQHDNYIRVWQWRSALAATLAPSYTNNSGRHVIGDNSPAGGSTASSYSSALVASNKLSSPITSLAVLTLPPSSLSSGANGDTASSTGHSTNDDVLTAADDDDGASDDENDNMESVSNSANGKRTHIIIVTAGMHHLKYWYLDAALQGKGSQYHALRRQAKARQSTTSSKSTTNSNILPGKSIKLDEIEFFNSTSLFTFADVAIPSLQPHYIICCTRSPTAALLQFHTATRRLEKWVELKAAHAHCLAIAPYPFSSVQSDNAADTDAAVGIASAQRHNNFDHYQKYEVVFVGCSQGIIRVFDCDTLNVVISSLPRPHWLGISASEANQKGRPPQPPTLGGVTTSGADGVLLPASIVYPDCIALRYDAQHQHLAAVYSDHSLYIWDVRRLLSEKRIGKLCSFLAHSRCIWGLDSVIMPSISSITNSQQQGSGDFNQYANRATLLASSSSDNTVRLWRIPSVAGGGSSTEQKYQRSNSKTRQSYRNAVSDNDNSGRLELESIVYNTQTVTTTPDNDPENELMDVDANASTLSIEHLADAAFENIENNDNSVNNGKDNGNQGCRCVRISDDCRLLAAGYRDGNIRVFEIKFNGESHQGDSQQNILCNPLCRIEAHESEVLCLQFNTSFVGNESPSTTTTLLRSQKQQTTPHLLASGSRDRLIHLFNVRSEFAYVATIDCHSSSITALQFYFTTYTQAVQLQGGVKGGMPMQRRLYAAAKRHRHHQLLMLASCGLDKQVMFTHVDFNDADKNAAGADDEHHFEQIDAVTTPCAMYDMRLVRRTGTPSGIGAGDEDAFKVQHSAMVRGRRPTPAEPYDSSSNSSSPVVPAGRSVQQPHSRMQQQYNRMVTGEFDQQNENLPGQNAGFDLYTANQDQYVRVFDAIARKWVRSFHIDTGSGGVAVKQQNDARKNGAPITAAPAAVIKLDIAPVSQHSSISERQQQQLLLAASCSDKTLVLYDAVSGEPACAAPFYGHSELVTSLKLIDEGRRLVSAAGDSTLFVWRITPSSASISASQSQHAVSTVNRRRRTAGITADSSPSHGYSAQDLSGKQPKLMPSGHMNRDVRNKVGLPPTPLRGAAGKILRGDEGMQQQQRKYSDESDEDDGPQTGSGSAYSMRSSNANVHASGTATQQRRRSAAARASGASTLHHPHNRMSSQERLPSGRDAVDQHGTPSWAPRRRMAQSVERQTGMGSQQQLRAAGGSAGRQILGRYGDVDDDDDDRATNAAMGAERHSRTMAAAQAGGDAQNNTLFNTNKIATMQRGVMNNRRRNATGNDALQQHQSPSGELRVPSPSQAALSLQDTLLLLSNRANAGGLPPRSTPSLSTVVNQQQQNDSGASSSGNVMYYSVNSDTIRRGTTQQRQRSADTGTASVMSTPTSTSTTTSQSSAALRALQATAERRAAAAAVAAGRQSPQSPVSSNISLTTPSQQPAPPQLSSVRAAMETATNSVSSKRRGGQDLLASMNALDINRIESDEQQITQQNVPQPPPRRNISSTALSNTKFPDAPETMSVEAKLQSAQLASAAPELSAGNDDDAVIESLVGTNIERGGKQRLSLTRRHMKAAKDRMAAKQQQNPISNSQASVAEEEPVSNQDEEAQKQLESNVRRRDKGQESNVGWVAAQRAQLNAHSVDNNARQQQQQHQYSNVRSMFAGELSKRNLNNNKNLQIGPGGGIGGAIASSRVSDVGGGTAPVEHSLGAESPPQSTIGSPHHSPSSGEEENVPRSYRY